MNTMEFSRLRHTHPLPGFFEEYLGAKKTVVSGGARYSVCPACGASSNDSVKVSVRGEKWRCFSCDKKGDVVDAAALYWGKSLREAALDLVGQVAPIVKPAKTGSASELPVKRNQEAINKMIELLLDCKKIVSDGVIDYLASRSIQKSITLDAANRGLLIGLSTDPDKCLRFLLDVVGRDLLVEAGVWKKDSRAPGVIYRPLIFVSADRRGAEFRRISATEQKSPKAIRYGEPSPFFWCGSENTMIVEGAIDMLSAVALGSDRSIVGLAGASNWSVEDKWVQWLGKRGHVLIALDADNAGNDQAKKMADYLFSHQCAFRRHILPEGIKDLNEMLQFVSTNDHP